MEIVAKLMGSTLQNLNDSLPFFLTLLFYMLVGLELPVEEIVHMGGIVVALSISLNIILE